MRIIGTILVCTALSLGGAACSSDDSTGGETDPSPAPEEVTTSAAAVATGLTAISGTVSDIADVAGTDQAAAEALVEEIEPVWEEIEGTVKANDPDAYVTFEDNFALIGTAVEEGDAQQAGSAATAVSDAVTAYLASYPG
jgi:hypothetical protein